MDFINNKILIYNKLNKKKAFLIFLLIAFITLFICLLPIIVTGKYNVWADGVKQHLPFLEYYKDNNWFSLYGDYSFNLGFGSDYITSFSFYALFDPFNIIYFILPFNKFMNYSIIMFIKQIACAISFYVYIKYHNVNNTRAMILSIIYMITGFVLFTSTRHYNLTCGPIYFPLVILGLEMMYDKKSPLVLFFSVFFAFISSFYSFFSISVFAVVYIITKNIDDQFKEKNKYSFKEMFLKLYPLGIVYIIAVFTTSFILLPNIYGYLNAARGSSKGLISISFLNVFSKLASFILPVMGQSYTVVMLNVPIMILLIYLLFKPNRDTRLLKIHILVLVVGVIFPIFGYAMNLFNYCNNRWTYALNFYILVLFGIDKNAYLDFEGDSISKTKEFLFYFALFMFTLIVPTVYQTIYREKFILFFEIIVIIIDATLITLHLKKKNFSNDLKGLQSINKFFYLTIIITILCAIGYNCSLITTLHAKESNAVLYTNEEAYVSKLNKEEFFRTDYKTLDTWRGSYNNRPLNNDYYGTREYNSVSNKTTYNFYKNNGIYNPANTLGVCGLDSRFALESLLSCKYYITDNNVIPYGFTKDSNYDDLYLNDNYLSFGYMYYNYISKSDYNNSCVLDRQYLLTKGIVLDNIDSNVKYNSCLNSYEIANDITVKSNNEISYNIHINKDMETYLVLKDVGDVDIETSIKISIDGINREYIKFVKGNLMYTDNNTVYFNLSTFDNDKDTTLTLSTTNRCNSKGKISIGNILLYQADLTSVKDNINALKENEHLNDIKITSNSISGNINNHNNGYLFLSIPYSKGFSAYVDGKSVDVLEANDGFMAIYLESGDHNIELKYQTMYIKEGFIVSCCFILIGSILLGIYYIKKKNIE